MPKNYNARNSGKDGKIHKAFKQPWCKTCNDSGTVRISKPRRDPSASTQRYDIVSEKCPDCT